LVAVNDDVRNGVKHNTCHVQICKPPVSGSSILNHLATVCDVVVIVGDIVEQLNPCVEALINVVVVVIELGTDLELEGVLEGVGP